MSEASFAELLEDSLVTIHNGEIVEGTVIGVKDNEIILNIGYKADGILTKNEYSNNTDVDLTSEVKPGDTMTVKVLKVNDGEGQVLLTYKRLQQDKMNERFQEAFENQEVLTGKVSMVLKGVFLMVKAVCLSRLVWYPICMREIYPNIRIRKLNSFLLKLIHVREELLATANS